MKSKYRLFALVVLAFVIDLSTCRTVISTELETPPSTLSSGWSGSPLVETAYGKVFAEHDKHGTWVWKGIPYARPPVGELRWRAPRKPLRWDGILNNKSFPVPSLQFQPLSGGKVLTGSEDCLYLNVWRPESGEKNLPVYVWIHGGGNAIGSATMTSDTDGHTLAARGNIVFVSINYRLGPFGWFTHPSLRAHEDELDASGNYGTLDQIAALKWVRENIEAFGGNPDMVTIAGESAGGANVLTLLLSPLSEGLFHRAVVQSGYDGSYSMEDADTKSDELIRKILQDSGMAWSSARADEMVTRAEPEDIADFIRKLPAEEVMNHIDHNNLSILWPKLYRDGTVIPTEGFDAWSRGEHIKKDVPVIIGSNKDEIKLFIFFRGKLRRNKHLYDTVARYGSELWKATGVDRMALGLSTLSGHAGIYMYQFSWGHPREDGSGPLPGGLGRILGAAHFLDVPFFMGSAMGMAGLPFSLIYNGDNLTGRMLLSNAMMTYLINFIHTGNPNPTDSPLPEWPAWSGDDPEYITFNTQGNRLDLETRSGVYEAEEIIEEIASLPNGKFKRRVIESLSMWESVLDSEGE